MLKPSVTAFFDESTHTVSYVVSDPQSHISVIIDPVLDYDPASGCTETRSADDIVRFVQKERLQNVWILETHVHADHLSSAPYLQQTLGGKIAIGREVCAVQTIFSEIFNTEPGFRCDGSQFDHLFSDGGYFSIGELEAYAMYTPGHTPACVSYVIGDTVFVGDTMFMPDYGTARADFPGGDAGRLFRSIKKILSLAPETRLFLCHDYKSPGRDTYGWESTVAEMRAHNIHVQEGVSEEDFVAMREARDATLAVPQLILPAVQVNIRAGRMPPAEEDGQHYLKIPVNVL